MTKALFVVMVLVLLTLLSSFIKTLAGTVGLPNLMPALRDPLLLGVAIYGVSRLDFFASLRWPLLLASTLGFVLPYLCIAMLEGMAFVGLYYIRLYLLPFLFFVGALGVLEAANQTQVRKSLLSFFIRWNNFLFFVSLAIYVLLQVNPSMRSTLFGPDLLPTAWYISGGTWMRMGLPLSGPNALGLVFALNAFLFLSVFLSAKQVLIEAGISTKTILLSALLAICGLLLSFSRSSMLLLFFGLPLVLLLPGVMNFQKFFKFGFVSLVLLTIVLFVGLMADEFSDGYVLRWIELNTSFQDPSMLGHFHSINDAVDKFHEYMLWGYEKGSVGPKAQMFGGVGNNVENSFLAVFYDMGLIFGSVYWIAIATLFSTGYRSRLQLILLIGFFPPCFLLPYVFEADVLIYFGFVYLALGKLVTPEAIANSTALRRNHSRVGLAA